MANNPLYPGYSPGKKDEESVNPLYPGYYTGKPIRKKSKPEEFLKPVEFNFDVIANQIDEIGDTVANMPLGPKWVLDRTIDDWKGNLKVSVSPEANIEVTDIDDFATEDFAGAATTLSLNPKDWGVGHEDGLRQTRKKAIGTLKDWVKETTGIDTGNILNSNFSDIQNKANEELMFRALGFGSSEERTVLKGAKAVSKRIIASYPEMSGEDSPLNVKGVRAIEIDRNGRIIKHDDLYREVALSAGEFIKNRDNYAERNPSHQKFLSKVFDAAEIEINHHYMNGNDTVKNIIENHKGAKEFYDTRHDTLKEIEAVQKKLTGAGSITSKLKKIDYGIDKTTDVKTELNTIKTYIENQKNNLANLENRARDLRQQNLITQESLDRYLSHTKKYEKHFDYLSDNIGKAIDGDMGLKQTIKILSGRTPDKNFNNRTVFQDSLGGGLRKDLEKSLLSKDADEIGSLLNDRDLESAGVSLAAKKIAPVTRKLRQDKVQYDAREIFNAYDKGGLPQLAEAYLWKRIKNELPDAIERVTAGTWVGDTFKKTNYFGLKIDERGIPIDPKKLAKFEKKFGYEVEVGLDPEVARILGKNKIKVRGKEAVASFAEEGVVANLEILGDSKFKDIFKLTNKDSTKANKELFSKLLNNDRSDETLEQLSLLMFNKTLSEIRLPGQEKDIEELEKMVKKIESAGKWVESRSGGMISLAPAQTGTINLDSSIFGVAQFKFSGGKHLDVFQNNKIDLLLKQGLDKKTSEEQTQQIKRLLGLEGELNYREASLNKIVKLTTGKDFLSLSREEQDAWFAMAEEFGNFSKWIKSQRSVFGDKVDDVNFRYQLFLKFKETKPQGFLPVNVDETDPAFLLFQSVYKKNESLPGGYKLTDRRYIGRLEKINKKMQEWKGKWEKSAIGRTVKKISNWREIAAEKAAEAISKILSKLLGAAASTTGVLATILPIITALAERVIKKGIDYTVATIKGMMRLDFRDLDQLLQKDIKNITQSCFIIYLAITILVLLPTMFFFGDLDSTISPVDNTREQEFGEQAENHTLLLGACNFNEDLLNTLTPEIKDWYYSQCDPEYSGIQIDSSRYTIGSAGCTLTTIAMVYASYGYGCVTPKMIEEVGGFGTSGNLPYHNIEYWDKQISAKHPDCVPPGGSGISSQVNIGVGGKKVKDIESILMSWFSSHPKGLISLGMMYGIDNQHWVILKLVGGEIMIIDPYPTSSTPAYSEFPGYFENWTAVSNSTGYWKQP